MADLVDRHYALVANNQHPLQFLLYEKYAQMLKELNSP